MSEFNFSKEFNFYQYLVKIGIRSVNEFNYDENVLYENIEYFRKCYNSGLSEYKSLLYLQDYINNDFNI